VETIAIPVKEHTTIVSMNVWVIETSACRTGSRVWAAAAAMPAEPSPDSFEKMPRATPYRIAAATPAPRNPPAAAVPLNALPKIRRSASGTPR
jgi:hypothetical protein